MCFAPGCSVGPFATRALSSWILKGVTRVGTVKFIATLLGTPTWWIPKLGSAVMTVRAEKSTRFPIKLPRIRPSLALSLWLNVFRGRPLRCVTCGIPRNSLFMKAAQLCCSACSNCSTMMLGSPFFMAVLRAMLHLTMLTSWCVKSSSDELAPPPITTEGRTWRGGTGMTEMHIHSGLAHVTSSPSDLISSSLIFLLWGNNDKNADQNKMLLNQT